MSTPRVSIGIPLYNAERYLRFCLDGVAAQTYRDLEVVIADNASTDRTGEICREYASRDSRFRYVRNEKNLGAARNFNLVFELSKGEYFRWAAYDDIMAPRAVEACAAALDADPSLALAYPKTVIINEEGAEIERYDDDYVFADPDPARRFARFLRVVDERNCNPLFGLMRRDLLARTMLLGSYHSADKVLLAQMVLLGRFAEVPEYLFYRRYHALGSVHVNRTARAFAAWFDTGRAGHMTFPRWRRLAELLKSIGRSHLSVAQRARCTLSLIMFYMKPDKWKMLVASAAGNVVGLLSGKRMVHGKLSVPDQPARVK
ncbi:MAG TPA: glycosyltransferase family 2 protein [Bacteroidota bacterium]|nr:glycosyltransferase family 2 protein [Bacteroidota bacterium]